MTTFAKSGKIEEGKKTVALITSLLSGKKTLHRRTIEARWGRGKSN